MKHPNFLIKYFVAITLLTSLWGCQEQGQKEAVLAPDAMVFSKDILDFRITPKDSLDKSGLMYSDQGAWFAFSMPDSISSIGGFTGPFLMTEQNGIWASKSLVNLNLKGDNNSKIIDWNTDRKSQHSYASHLIQIFENDSLRITQQLYFLSGHTALQQTQIENLSTKGITLHPSVSGELFDIGLNVSEEHETIMITSEKSEAVGYVSFREHGPSIMTTANYYNAHFKTVFLKPGEKHNIETAQTYIFSEYNWTEEKSQIHTSNFNTDLTNRVSDKNKQINQLIDDKRQSFSEEKYSEILAKALLTMQNNWRIPAGEIKHSGLFPSYHYKWFNGFWAWDSWKHAAGLAKYDPALAKEQVKLMFEFQDKDGFVADCVFRDTLIEKHNYRNTKPPLSAWAVAEIFNNDKDLDFVAELFPKLEKYHKWWYAKRDHDQDGLCEYGSTDGTLVAAKWESGMDNAVRFDESKILKNSEGAYSLDQESVDLNAYLYAEKGYLATLAEALGQFNDAHVYRSSAERLQIKIQTQFYDENDGWFYDTNLDGTEFIKGMGSEGWTALWANAATQAQAESVMKTMMDENSFFTKVPFQTLDASHEKFNPLKGYWRGPNWLDQAYFGIQGFRNYSFNKEANRATTVLIEGANGILGKGTSIRENYHPTTGEGLNAKNFSWSAAHLIMLVTNDSK